jgi:hypothetical protein
MTRSTSLLEKSAKKSLIRRFGQLIAPLVDKANVTTTRKDGGDFAIVTNDADNFLRYLFGDNTKATGNGIFVSRDSKRRWKLTFRGNVSFYHEVVDGRPVSHLLKREAKRMSQEIADA